MIYMERNTIMSTDTISTINLESINFNITCANWCYDDKMAYCIHLWSDGWI